MTPFMTTIGLSCLTALALVFWQSRRMTRTRAAVVDHGRQIAFLMERLGAIEARFPKPERSTAPPSRPTPSRRVDPPETQAGSGLTLISVPNLASRGQGGALTEAEGPAGSRISERFGGLWELADSGASPSAIARAMGMPVGRVELVLGLRRRPSNPAPEGPAETAE